MSTLEDTVRSVVQDFIKSEALFTALDVSNTVKQVMPHSKHREVRDVIRGMFTSDIESQGWSRTPITVNLNDGSSTEAFLYHPLSDSWDLDNKYDAQKRSLTSVRPYQAAKATVAQAQAAVAPVVTAPVTTQATTTPKAATNTVSAPMPTAMNLWDNLFQTQPSLFPSK